jgi:hypothetical protein
MPLPQSDNFEALLASFISDKPLEGAGWREFIATPTDTVFKDGARLELPAISFWYRDEGNLTVEALQKRVSSELTHQGHLSNPEIAAAILGMFAFSKKSCGSAVQQFNDGLKVVSADLNQFFIFPAASPLQYRFDVGSFSIGPFKAERLAYQSKKAGSDFFVRYEESLRQLPLSVERKFRPVKVIDWHEVARTWVAGSDSAGKARTQLMSAYFALLAALHFQEFFAELQGVQEMPMALGSGWFNLERLQEILHSQRVSAFLNIGGRADGFVSPAATLQIAIDLGGAPLGIPFTEQYLREHFRFERFQSAEIHQSLRAFCHFLAKAVRHRDEGRQAEAFLHYIIALDLLLGDIGESSASVCSRSALLSFEALNRDYAALLQEMKRAYNARSKYVHEGRQPDYALLKIVEEICHEVAFCLLRLQRDISNHQPGFRDRWIKDVDFMVAAVEAVRPTIVDDLKRAGIATPQDVRYLDYFSELAKPT